MKKLNRLALTASMLSVLLCVSGCDAFVYPKDFEEAEKLCENNEGIDVFIANSLFYAKVNCVNGAKFEFIGKA